MTSMGCFDSALSKWKCALATLASWSSPFPPEKRDSRVETAYVPLCSAKSDQPRSCVVQMLPPPCRWDLKGSRRFGGCLHLLKFPARFYVDVRPPGRRGKVARPQHLQGSVFCVLNQTAKFLLATAEPYEVPTDLSSAWFRADFDPTSLLALAWSKLHGIICILVVFEIPSWKMKNNISVSARSLFFHRPEGPTLPALPALVFQLLPVQRRTLMSILPPFTRDVSYSLCFLFASLLCGRISNNS